MHNQPLIIRVEFVPEDTVKGYRAKNEIKAWKSCSGAPVTQTTMPSRPSAPMAAQQPAPAAQQAAMPPWKAGAR